MNEDGNKAISVIFTPEHSQDFEFIKRYYGIVTSSDMLRFLVTHEARRIRESNHTPTPAGVNCDN